MEITIKVEAQNQEELRTKLAEMFDLYTENLGSPAVSVKEAAPITNGNGHQTPAPVKPRGRPAKAKPETTEPVAETAAAEVVAEVAKENVLAAKVTNQDVMEALKKVNSTKGLNTAREILGKFQAQRLSEVKETDWAAFIDTCEKACG